MNLESLTCLWKPVRVEDKKLWTSPLEKAAYLAQAERAIFSILLAMITFGIVMIYSSSSVRSLHIMDPSHFLRRQILWALLGIFVLLLFWNTDYRKYYDLYPRIMMGMILVLAAVLIPGIGAKVNGARRWIRIAGLGLQPSEFAKIGVLILAASYAVAQKEKLASFKEGFLPIIIPLGIISALVLMEPDLGTSLFLFTIAASVLLVGGMPLRHFLPFALLAIPPALIVAYFKFSHIKTRLLVFLYPEMDPTGKGHQIRQSLIALGSGGWMGLGLGESRQKLFFLPEDHTDFILAIIGEEFGFLGTLVVILLFLGILYYGRRIMNFASHMFGHLLAFGILFSFAFQGILNIAVVTASMPTKGISLPLISFGGSGMLSTMMAFGILLNISKARRMELIKNYFGNNKL